MKLALLLLIAFSVNYACIYQQKNETVVSKPVPQKTLSIKLVKTTTSHSKYLLN